MSHNGHIKHSLQVVDGISVLYSFFLLFVEMMRSVFTLGRHFSHPFNFSFSAMRVTFSTVTVRGGKMCTPVMNGRRSFRPTLYTRTFHVCDPLVKRFPLFRLENSLSRTSKKPNKLRVIFLRAMTKMDHTE